MRRLRLCKPLDRLLHTERVSWDSAYTMGVAAVGLPYIRNVKGRKVRKVTKIQPVRLPSQLAVYDEGLNAKSDGAELSCHDYHRAWTDPF